MERLIDADALKEAMNYNGGCGICFRYIDNAPTIDAIPVEWLENQLKALFVDAMGAGGLYGDRIGELAKSINEVMKLWQREQEAKDGKTDRRRRAVRGCTGTSRPIQRRDEPGRQGAT